ncbi:MAG: cell division protein FtsZ, partial [Butyricicoccus sp.]
GMVQAAAHPDAHIIFGASIDEDLDDELRVVVIATGFDNVPESAKGPDGKAVPPVGQQNVSAGAAQSAFQTPFRAQQAEQQVSQDTQQMSHPTQAEIEDDAFKAIIDIFNHNN